MIVRVKSRGRNTTGRSRARDRWSRNAKPAVPVNAVPVKGAGLRLVGFGKHKGKRYADVPLGYLRWMIREKCQAWKNARAEIERRRWSARKFLSASGPAEYFPGGHEPVPATADEAARFLQLDVGHDDAATRALPEIDP